MRKLKQFRPKDPAGLEGRILDVGHIKLQILSKIAEGGFSSVYLASAVNQQSKQYAVKHVICQDDESLDLAMKEISVMKILTGHPNVVELVGHSVLDMGRTKEALLVMEFCEKSLVGALENRGGKYFEEKQLLIIFRDVCNAVFAMHCQSPPIAHRDLKAENVLLGDDGAWKLCDFGSTSTNHKCFSRPEEMGIEEDNIRKHTTPAYRAPEMWDLYRREVISEKVDIWALGCLLYRICYLKSAFDGESKLQILNGNYRIPESPNYDTSITNLIKDMLQASPNDRPDITQVWFRVNESLPVELQKDLPDNSPSISADGNGSNGIQKRNHLMPRRSPPPPPSLKEDAKSVSSSGPQHPRSSQGASRLDGAGSALGSFWSTQHAQDSQMARDKGPVFDEEAIDRVHPKHFPSNNSKKHASGLSRNSYKSPESGSSEDFEITFSPNGSEHLSSNVNNVKSQSKVSFDNKAFNTSFADFDNNPISSGNNSDAATKSKSRLFEEELETEVSRLKEELNQVNSEKVEITSKFNKLSSICRSQRQEIQELKNSIASANSPPPDRESSRTQVSRQQSQSETLAKTTQKLKDASPELQKESMASRTVPPISVTKPSNVSDEEPKVHASRSIHPKSVRTVRASSSSSSRNSLKDSNSFEHGSFKATPGSGTSNVSINGNTSLRFSSATEAKNVETSKPAGWAGF